jgi:RNA polymerase sigma factor (sigma-70 family)
MAKPPTNLLHTIRRLAGDSRGDTRSDAELLAAFAAAKDEGAFTALVARHGRQVWAECIRILGQTGESQVDDCFQAVFIALARKAHAVAGVSLPSWLAETARRTAMEARRRDTRRRVRQQELADHLDRPKLVEGAAGYDGETAEVLKEELDRLPDKLRTPVVLFYLEGRTQVQVAAFLRCDQSVVSRRLSKALDILRQRLESRGLGVASVTLATWLGYLATAEASSLPQSGAYGAAAKAAVAAVSGAKGGASPAAVTLAAAVLRPRIAVWWLAAGGLFMLGGTRLIILHGEHPSPHAASSGVGAELREPVAQAGSRPMASPVGFTPRRALAAVKTGFVDKLYKHADGRESKYVVFVPYSYDGTKEVPVILFLHGSGETKGGQKMPVEVGIGPAIRKREQTFPFLTIIPQAETGSSWQATGGNARRALAMLDDVTKEYKTDPKRVYLTGVSTGGVGTWSLAMAYPNRWAAIVPVCGRGDVKQAEKIKDLPCWCFHGEADRLMPVAGSREMIEALRKAGGKPIYSEYEGVGHNVWDTAYDTDELYNWLLNHSKK